MKLKELFSTRACGVLLWTIQFAASAAAPSVSLEEAQAALDHSSAVVVDIREPSEHASGVAKGALLIPMGQLSQRLGDITTSKTQPLILVCASQNRSSKMADQLQAAGYTHVSYVKGGMNQWTARGWPKIKP